MESLGENLRMARKSLRLSQKEFGDRIGAARSTVAAIEGGR